MENENVIDNAVKSQITAIDKLIKADLKAMTDKANIEAKLETADNNIFEAVVNLLRGSKDLLAIPGHAALLKQHIKDKYTSDSVARKRVTLLEGCRMVAYGGTTGSKSRKTLKTVKGFGWGAVEEVLKKATTINELSALLTKAKPDGLKNPNKSNSKDDGDGDGDGDKGETGVGLTKQEAEILAIDALNRVAAFCTSTNDEKLLTACNGMISMLKAELHNDAAEAEAEAKAELAS